MSSWRLQSFNSPNTSSLLKSPELFPPSNENEESVNARPVELLGRSDKEGKNDNAMGLDFEEGVSFETGFENDAQRSDYHSSAEAFGSTGSTLRRCGIDMQSLPSPRAAKRQRRFAVTKEPAQVTLSENGGKLQNELSIDESNGNHTENLSTFPETWFDLDTSLQLLGVEKDECNGEDFTKLWINDSEDKKYESPIAHSTADIETLSRRKQAVNGAKSMQTALQTLDNCERSRKMGDKKWKYGVKGCALSVVHYFLSNGGGRVKQDDLVELLLCKEAEKLGLERKQLGAKVVKEVKRRTYDVLNILVGSGNLSRDDNADEDERVVKWEGHEGHRRLLRKLKKGCCTEDGSKEETKRLSTVLEEQEKRLADVKKRLRIFDQMKGILAKHEEDANVEASECASAEKGSDGECINTEGGTFRKIYAPFIAFTSAGEIHVSRTEDDGDKRLDIRFEGPYKVMSDWELMEMIIKRREGATAHSADVTADKMR